MLLTRVQSDEIIDRLRQTLAPDEIYLFGSQASGEATLDSSDVDLCVIVPDDDESTYHKAVRAYQSLRGLGIPKDIIVRHRSRFAERARWLSSIERDVAENGIRVYVR